MPDTRKHRGPDPRDPLEFGASSLPRLRSAVADLSWLLGRGYAMVSAVKLVGDRWSLTERQRLGVRRAACSDEALALRLSHLTAPEDLSGRALMIDGFNLLTTVEAALGGGLLLGCRDGTIRDLAGVHGTYRKVAETVPAALRIKAVLAGLSPGRVHWLLDRPVSNSGRVRQILLDAAGEEEWSWTVELVQNPDPLLCETKEVIATADSAILDRCTRWINLARIVVQAACPEAPIRELSGPSA